MLNELTTKTIEAITATGNHPRSCAGKIAGSLDIDALETLAAEVGQDRFSRQVAHYRNGNHATTAAAHLRDIRIFAESHIAKGLREAGYNL